MIRKYFTREVKIGLMVVVAGFVLFFGFNYLKGINIFNPSNYYYVTFDSLRGLNESSSIYIRGYKVGMISQVQYDFTSKHPFVITLDIDRSVRLPRGTTASLINDGLLGGKAISLDMPAQVSSNPEIIDRGDTLKSEIAITVMDRVTNDLVPKIDHLLLTTDSLIASVRKITESPEMAKSLKSVQNLTNNLDQSSRGLKRLMKNQLPHIAKNVNSMTKNLSETSQKINNIDFASTVNNVDNTMYSLQNVTKKMDSKDGSFGLLLNDPSLYNNLSSASKHADSLLYDVKANPHHYVHFSIFDKKKK